MLRLVNPNKLKKDPRKLPYLYPNMSVYRYKDQTEEFYRLYVLHLIEKMAQMFDCVLLPSSCVHHRRRNADRRIMIFGRSYYITHINNLTDLEWEKYRIMCENQ